MVILHRALVESRNLALGGKSRQQLIDLADTCEIIPEYINRWQEDHLQHIQAILSGYQAKYSGTAYDYLAILNMDDGHFQELYQLGELASDPKW